MRDADSKIPVGQALPRAAVSSFSLLSVVATIGCGFLPRRFPLALAGTNYGAIRGLALSTQVLAQASGPLLSGILYELT